MEIGKATIVLRDKKWVTKEALSEVVVSIWIANQQTECLALKELKLLLSMKANHLQALGRSNQKNLR